MSNNDNVLAQIGRMQLMNKQNTQMIVYTQKNMLAGTPGIISP